MRSADTPSLQVNGSGGVNEKSHARGGHYVDNDDQQRGAAANAQRLPSAGIAMLHELSPEEAFDLLVGQMENRMEEYLVSLREIPNVSGDLKLVLWRSAETKREEINELQRKLDEARGRLAQEEPPEATVAATILQEACNAAGWQVQAHNDARVLVHALQQDIQLIQHPVSRASASDWLRRALRYAETGRRAPATMCIAHASALRR